MFRALPNPFTQGSFIQDGRYIAELEDSDPIFFFNKILYRPQFTVNPLVDAALNFKRNKFIKPKNTEYFEPLSEFLKDEEQVKLIYQKFGITIKKSKYSIIVSWEESSCILNKISRNPIYWIHYNLIRKKTDFIDAFAEAKKKEEVSLKFPINHGIGKLIHNDYLKHGEDVFDRILELFKLRCKLVGEEIEFMWIW